MDSVLMVVAIACGGMLAALAWLVAKLNFSGSSLPVTAEWIEELSIEPYKPMLRLEVVREYAGKADSVERRIQRCREYRQCLRSLTADFSRVSTALKLVLQQSGLDRPDLASILIHRQILFACGLALVHSRLFLYRWGICDVDITGLVRLFDGLRLELQSIVTLAEPMSA